MKTVYFGGLIYLFSFWKTNMNFRTLFAPVLFVSVFGSVSLNAAQVKNYCADTPVRFIYADGQDCTNQFDIDARWAAIPKILHPYVLLDIFMSHEFIYRKTLDGDIHVPLASPEHRKDFPEMNRLFIGALDRAQELGVKILLQMR